MLPAPVTFTKSNPLRRSPILHPCRLPFLLLLLLCSISLLLNAFYMYQKNHLCISSAFSATVTRRVTIRGLNHLIIVPGHAIWKGGDPRLRLDNDQWLLEPYQKSGRRVAAFFAHIERGAELARNDGASLLVFSGGQTRLLSTTTEAQSYMALATSADVFHSPAPFLRATTEDYALDSFQNLLFSIARFHEYTGHYPIEITVVGYEFKRLRFIDLHRTAIRWPIQRFHYIGIDPEDGHNLTAAEEGEVGCEHFMSYFLSDIFSESLVICLFPTTHMDVTLYSSRRDDKGIHSSDSIRTTRRVQSCSRYLIGVRLLAMEAKLHYSKAIYLGTDRASFDLMGYSLNVSIPSCTT